MKNFPRYNSFLVVLIFVCIFLFFLNSFSIHFNVVEGNAVSNVTIQKSLAIAFSENLSEGINFGVVNTLPAINLNASHNYDGSNNGTSFYLIVDLDSNLNVDFCVKASGDLVSSYSDVLGLENETYSHYNSTNITHPDLDLETSLTIDYVRAGEDIPIGGNNYYRFWLDIPGAQPSGNYNNTVYFKGVQTGYSC